MARRVRRLCAAGLAAGLVTAAPPPVLARQAGPAPSREAPLGALAAPPAIDGRLEEAEWADATRLSLAYQIEPGDNLAASEPTDVYLAADAGYLYIAFHARDRDPDALRARVVKRDDVSREDWVGVYLDTYDNRQRAYLFRFNPLGVQEDAIYTDGTPLDVSWDGVVRSHGEVTSDGYVVEAAIAFSHLRYRAGPGARWGLLLQRRIARLAETTSWLPRSRDISGLLQQAGSLTALDNVPARRSLSLIPTLTGVRLSARDHTVAGGRLVPSGDTEASLTGIFAFSPTTIVAATVNPDFSQIESDVPQIDVNQRFALTNPENRPFFLEGTEIFSPLSEDLMQLVDTRQIVDPDWGLKLTARAGRQTIGVLASADRAPGLRPEPADPTYGSATRFTIARVQRDLLEDSALGVWAIDQRFAGTSNSLVAFDGRIRLSPATQLLMDVAGSRSVLSAGGDRLSGVASSVRVNHDGRHWRIYAGNRYAGPGYRNEAGFIDRTDFHEQALDVGYEWRPAPASRLNRWLVYVWPYLDMLHSRVASDGSPEIQFIDPAVKVQFQRDVSINCYPSFYREGFAGRTFRYTLGACDHTVDAFKHVSFVGSFQVGGGLHYDAEAPVVGRAHQISQEIVVRAGDAISVGLVFLQSRLRHRESDARLVDQRIVRTRVAWQWTRFHAIRAIVEHDTATRELGTSLLYSWTPSPNTAVYAGWNDQLVRSDVLERPSRRWVRERRTLFLKLSYDLRR
jgi:hypothetical protein